MMGFQAQIGVIGGLHVDRIAHGDRTIVADTSTPGLIITKPGGVAANVAQMLAALGHTVAVAGRVGADGDGALLMAALKAMGIDVSAVDQSAVATASYLAIHEPDGALHAAIADSRATESVSGLHFRSQNGGFSAAPAWFLDANLSVEAIREIIDAKAHRWIAADCVSIAKAERLSPHLGSIDLLFANIAEAGVLCGHLFNTAEDAAFGLCSRGVGCATVTAGAAGFVIAKAGQTEYRAPKVNTIVDVTGAGDAVIAGVLSGHLRSTSLAAAADLAAAATSAILRVAGADASALAPLATSAQTEAT